MGQTIFVSKVAEALCSAEVEYLMGFILLLLMLDYRIIAVKKRDNWTNKNIKTVLSKV